MTRTTPLFPLRLLGAVLLAMMVFASPVAADDDDDDDGMGSYIHQGTCNELGDEVEDIENLDGWHEEDDDDDDDRDDYTRIWERIQGEGDAPERFWADEDDDVDEALDQLMASDHVITVHETEDNDSPVLVCGAISGDLDDNGGLLIDLEEYEDSGYEGRAYLIPDEDDDDDDDDDTEVNIGVWEVQAAGV